MLLWCWCKYLLKWNRRRRRSTYTWIFVTISIKFCHSFQILSSCITSVCWLPCQGCHSICPPQFINCFNYFFLLLKLWRKCKNSSQSYPLCHLPYNNLIRNDEFILPGQVGQHCPSCRIGFAQVNVVYRRQICKLHLIVPSSHRQVPHSSSNAMSPWEITAPLKLQVVILESPVPNRN